MDGSALYVMTLASGTSTRKPAVRKALGDQFPQPEPVGRKATRRWIKALFTPKAEDFFYLNIFYALKHRCPAVLLSPSNTYLRPISIQ